MPKKELQNKDTANLKLQSLPQKFSKCPYCGSKISRYSNYNRNDWEEDITFKCGLSVYSRTPSVHEEVGKCKNSKEWKKLVNKRLKELEMIKTYTNEILTDKILIKKLNSKYSSLEYNIKRWWHN